MQTTETKDRWTEIRTIHHQHLFFYQILGGTVLVALGMLLGAAIFAQDDGYATNLYTEILSIGVTVFILNLLAERREEARRTRDLQAQLVRDAGSTSNEAAKRAIDELSKRGWLRGESGLLQGSELSGGRLQDAILAGANLQNTRIVDAKLNRVNLYKANLSHSLIWGCDMREAKLGYLELNQAKIGDTDLSGAKLWFANFNRALVFRSNFENADLSNTNLLEAKFDQSNLNHAQITNAKLHNVSLVKASLHNADLQFSNMQGADLLEAELNNAQFNEYTILPDGTHWTPDTDLTRFTDPSHPHFWRSSYPFSPAYRGRDDTMGTE